MRLPLRTILVNLPPEGTVTVEWVLDRLEQEGGEVAPPGEETPESTETEGEEPSPWSWRERIWTVPEETRLETHEVLEALGKGRTWLHARMKEEEEEVRFPHRKLDGSLWFVAGEVRDWIRRRERAAHAPAGDGTLPTHRPPRVGSDLP